MVRLRPCRPLPGLCAAVLAVCCSAAHPGRLDVILDRGPVPYLRGMVLRQQTGNATAGAWSHPAAGDWDGDGDEDLLVGSGYGDLLYFQREATGFLAEPVQMMPEAFSLVYRPLAPGQVSPCLTDWNADGRLDVVLGLRGRIYLCRRSDGGLDPPVELQCRAHGVGALIRAQAGDCGHLAPCVADIDLDGDLDLLVGDDAGSVWWVMNEGSRGAPVLSEPRRLAAGGEALRVAGRARVAAGDWNGDGYPDLIIGSSTGTLYLCRGTPQGPGTAEPIYGVGTGQLPADTASPADLAPALSQWFGTGGGFRLLVGERRGFVGVLGRVEGGAAKLEGYLQAVNAPVDLGRCAVADPADWDGDGDLDLIAGGEDGYVQMFERVGNDPPRFAPGRRVVDRRGPLRAEERPGIPAHLRYAWPWVMDLDRDGDLDLLLGQASGTVRTWLNRSGFHAPETLRVAGADLRLPGATTVSSLDYDQDGDPDVLVGTRPIPGTITQGHCPPETVIYLENVVQGKGRPPLFVKAVSIDAYIAPANGRDLGSDADILGFSFVQPMHWNRDGILDFLVTTRVGAFIFRANTSRSEYARLEMHSPGSGIPLPLLPPAWSHVAARLTGGDPGLLCGLEETGWIVWYPRGSLRGPEASIAPSRPGSGR